MVEYNASQPECLISPLYLGPGVQELTKPVPKTRYLAFVVRPSAVLIIHLPSSVSN